MQTINRYSKFTGTDTYPCEWDSTTLSDPMPGQREALQNQVRHVRKQKKLLPWCIVIS